MKPKRIKFKPATIRRLRKTMRSILKEMMAKQAYDEFWSDPCWSTDLKENA